MVQTEDHGLVDILMPTYNAEPALIRAAVDSVIAQGYTSWVLHIGMDGGETGAERVAAECGDGRVRFTAYEHRGKPATLNEMHRGLSGRYVAYLDDDDLWYPDHLVTCLRNMVSAGSRFAYTNFHEVGRVPARRGGWMEISRSPMNRGALTSVFLFKISHSNIVVERSLLELAGSYDESRRYFIDWDMLIRLAGIERPMYVDCITGEYNVYYDRRGRLANRISSIKQDDDEKEHAFREMVTRSRGRITDEDMVAIASDLMRCKFPRPWPDAFNNAVEELVVLRLGLYCPTLYKAARAIGRLATPVLAAVAGVAGREAPK